jgi:hypothetical protein
VDVGVDSFAAVVTDPDSGTVVESAERMAHLLEEIALHLWQRHLKAE